MMRDQIANLRLDLGRAYLELVGHLSVRGLSVWAQPGFLARIEFGVHYQAMFEVIYPNRRRFFESDRAQVAGHLDSVFMRCFDGGSQLVRSYMHVGLERLRAFRYPIVDGAAGVVRVF